jgi:PAS domain S-box-containing protein
MVIGVSLYGAKLSRTMTASLRENERQRRALEASDARMRAIVDNAAEGIVIINQRGVIESFNRAAGRIFGYNPDDIIGGNVAILAPASIRDQHDGFLARYLQTGEGNIVGEGREVEGRRRDGSIFPMHIAVSEVRVGTVLAFTGIVHDLTERKRVELALRHAKVAAEAISHDLLAINDVHQRLFACRSVQEVGAVLTNGLTARFGAAFAGVWLIRPGDRCSECPLIDHCSDFERCLHLIAGSGCAGPTSDTPLRLPLGSHTIAAVVNGRGERRCGDACGDIAFPSE